MSRISALAEVMRKLAFSALLSAPGDGAQEVTTEEVLTRV